MDFESTDISEAAEQGREMHILHPVLGHRLYEGEGADRNGFLTDHKKPHKKITMIVRGLHSATVAEVVKRAQRQGMETDEDKEKSGAAFIDALVVDWSGITRGGKVLPCTKANKVWLTERNPSYFQQIQKFAEDQANFFEGEPTD